MTISSTIRTALIALLAFVAFSTASRAESGTVTLTIYKAGWIIGGSGGSGVLDFHGRRYRLSTGGLDYGLVFGGSKTVLHGRVSNIQPAVGRCGRLRGGGRRPDRRPRRARDHPDQPEGRRARTHWPPGRFDGERGPQRLAITLK